MNKLKTLIICHFSNSKVREHLPLDDRKLFNKIRNILGLSSKGNSYSDLASWDTNLIENLSKRDDIDLYVISAHSGLRKSVVNFEDKNVKYWFIRCDIATGMKHIISNPVVWHYLNPMRFSVRKIVDKIQPDVIALIGAENPHISGTILGLEKKYPVIVKTQTIYNNPERKKVKIFDLKNAYVEKQIFDKIHYFSVCTEMHKEMFRNFNMTAYNLKWKFGTTYTNVIKVEKEFDFVNFAMRISDNKGFYDALKALSIVKSKYPKIKLNLVGGAMSDDILKVKNLVSELNLEHNVILTPLFEKQQDMFQHIQKARFALLPCKLDYISGTISQAMHYELPVICYKTDGTITLNENEDCVLIAENGNVNDLSEKMMMYMDHPEVATVLAKAAKKYSDRNNDNEVITDEIVSVLKAIVKNFRTGTPIPEELLYDKDNL